MTEDLTSQDVTVMVSAEVKALLAAAQEAEERGRRYGRLAAQLVKLALALYILAFVATAIGLAVYLLHGLWLWQIAAAGLALWIAWYATHILHNVYNYRAVKAARRACVFRRTAEAVAEIERIMAKLEKRGSRTSAQGAVRSAVAHHGSSV